MKNEPYYGMDRQPKEKAWELAVLLREILHSVQGQDLGHGLLYENGALVSRFNDRATPYLLDKDGRPLTVFHYRNLTTDGGPDREVFHDLMHFGTLKAAHTRAFLKRSGQTSTYFSETSIGTEAFNRCSDTPVPGESAFGKETLFAVWIKAKSPFFMPDIGQTHYFRNRAVLYASGLFSEAEVDNDLFDAKGFPQEDIDRKVVQRLKREGYDLVAYTNDVEDPDSLSFVVLDKGQIEPVCADLTAKSAFRFRFGLPGDKKIMERDSTGAVLVFSDNRP